MFVDLNIVVLQLYLWTEIKKYLSLLDTRQSALSAHAVTAGPTGLFAVKQRNDLLSLQVFGRKGLRHSLRPLRNYLGGAEETSE